MNFSTRTVFYVILVVMAAWVVYLGRAVLPPFILAAGFAYLLNPLVTLLTKRIRLPRVAAIVLIYALFIGVLTILALTVGADLVDESESFAAEARGFLHEASLSIGTLPLWLQPIATDLLTSARGSFISMPRHVVTFLPGVVNGTINILVFLVAAFYFLKDGHQFITNVFGFLPGNWRREGEEIVRKVNKVLGDYLRAQLILVVIMSTLTYIGLVIMGVKYALVLAIFTGFAEIIPFIGPVIAAAIAMLVAYTDGVSFWGLDPVWQMAAVGIYYTILRQLEDLFVIPNILGRMTKLHPVAVLFAVLLGGHLFGVLGVILAVPLTASLKVVLEHLLSRTSKPDSVLRQQSI